MRNHLFKETSRITGLLYTQQRWKIFLWLIGFGVIVLAMAAAYPSTYPDEEARRGFAMTVNNPAMQALVGTGYSLQNFLSTTATLLARETLIFTLIVVAVMNILLVSGTARGDEEDGRTEYIRSLPAGRLSYLGSSIIVITVVNLLLALIIGTGLWLLNIDGTNFHSSYLYGAILGSVGLVFAAVTALVAQLAKTGRGTTMMSFGVLAVAFLIRAFGDVSSDTLSLVSPLGWATRSGVFIDNNWWPVYSCLMAAIIIAAGAFYLNSIRDMDAGFMPSKPGKKHASAFLTTPFGFIFYQQRLLMIVWAIFLFVFSAMFGTVLGDMEKYFADNPLLEKILQGESGVQDQFVTLLLGLMSLASAIPATMIVMGLKKEEATHRIEHFYSKSVSRSKLMGNYLLMAVITSIVLQGLIAAGFWVAGISVLDQPLEAGDIFLAAFVYLLAIWTILGLSLLLVGLIPSAASIIWLYLVYAFIVLFFDGLIDFRDWLSNLSVFEFIPALPADDIGAVPVIVLLGISLVTVLTGLAGYNKRDINI